MKVIAYLFPIVLCLLILDSCHKGDEPVSCTLSGTPYLYNQGGALVALPTAFTPNGDGRNDMYRAVGATNLQSFGLAVYDNNGSILFQTTDPYSGWDGRSTGGGVVPAGRYVVEVQFKTVNGDFVDAHTCVALLGLSTTGSCFITGGQTFIFADQMDPSTGAVVYGTGENLCPY